MEKTNDATEENSQACSWIESEFWKRLAGCMETISSLKDPRGCCCGDEFQRINYVLSKSHLECAGWEFYGTFAFCIWKFSFAWTRVWFIVCIMLCRITLMALPCGTASLQVLIKWVLSLTFSLRCNVTLGVGREARDPAARQESSRPHFAAFAIGVRVRPHESTPSCPSLFLVQDVTDQSHAQGLRK